jgi:hypothetical protein
MKLGAAIIVGAREPRAVIPINFVRRVRRAVYFASGSGCHRVDHKV